LRACPSAFRCLDYEHDPIEAAERIIAAMLNAPQIEHAGSKAFYSPITDRITLPPRQLFARAEEYYERFACVAQPLVERRDSLRSAIQGSIRLARLAETLPAINYLQTIGSLQRQHPPWILRGKSADLIQLPELVLGECEFSRREIIMELVEAFRANDDRGYHRL